MKRRLKRKIGIFGPMIVPLIGVVSTCKSPNTTRSSMETTAEPTAEESSEDPSDQSLNLTGGIISRVAAELKNAGSVVLGPFRGGNTGTYADESERMNVADLTSSSIPPGGFASPLYGAQPWTQKLLLVEEFGTRPIGSGAAPSAPFPALVDSQDPNNPELGTPKSSSGPSKVAIDALISAPGLNPFPSRTANTTQKNPWWTDICDYLKSPGCRSTVGPAEGRPPGEGWAHQRWNEFSPQVSSKATQSGARENLGVRNQLQMHKYATGEFAPGGLYHNTVGAPGFDGTTKGIKPQFHPNFPVQDMRHLWTFDGTFPVKLMMARYGEPILFRHYNLLPINVAANGGFGNHTISTHEHNGHNPAESDGFTGAFFFPGQFYDYRWPMVVAGYDAINVNATDPRMSIPCAAGEILKVNRRNGLVSAPCDVSRDPTRKFGIVNLRGDYRELMSSHWFHDHMIDFTAKNVYKGNAAVMNYYSGVDRGNESVNDGINLKLPSGSALPWGNRDYDINLAIGDKAWDANGQLWFNSFDTDGFLGDQVLVNMTWRPELDVRARRYRFRILNASVARYYKLAMVREIAGEGGSIPGPAGSGVSYETVPFHIIGNDGNIMEHSVAVDGTLGTQKGILPTQSIAERFDIIVDFAANGIKPGEKLLLVNTQEHTSGKLPNKQIPLTEIMSGSYKAVLAANNYWTEGDPGVGPILRFAVKPCTNSAGAATACQDQSMDPSRYVENNRFGPAGAALKMIPRAGFTAAELAAAKHHTYEFVRGGGGGNGTDQIPWSVKVDDNPARTADVRRISVATSLADLNPNGNGKVQIWHIKSSSGGWSHPVHVHFEEGQILKRGGNPPPIWEKWARKDMYRVGPEADSTGSVDLAIRVREFSGTYVEHCHNTTHEDHAMLIRWDSEKPGQTTLMPAPSPSWFGVNYVDSVAEETFRSGSPTSQRSTFISLNGVVASGQVMQATGVGANCSFKAAMQADGNFVLYRGATPIWNTVTAGKAAGGKLQFQGDSNIVLSKRDNTPVWQSKTVGKGASQMVLEGTGRIVLKNSGGIVVWSSNKPVAGCSM